MWCWYAINISRWSLGSFYTNVVLWQRNNSSRHKIFNAQPLLGLKLCYGIFKNVDTSSAFISIGKSFLHTTISANSTTFFNGTEITCFGTWSAFQVEFSPLQIVFVQHHTFHFVTQNFHAVAKILVSWTCLITINLKLSS